MWNLRSAAHHAAPAFICLISTLIAGGAHAQTATDASDTKRVQVLQIREASATNESSAKKSKTAATPAKKKVVQRKTIRQTKAAANEDAHGAGTQIPDPNTPVQSTVAVVAPATPAQNDGLTLSAEQTGTLAVGDRAVALASSPGEDNNVGFSTANYVGTREDQSASALTMGNPPRAAADADQNPGTQMVGPQVPSSRNSPLSQSLATPERSNAGGGVRLVSGELKPEARFRLTYFANAFNLAKSFVASYDLPCSAKPAALRCMTKYEH